jgi:hypothetical protein
MSGGYDSAKCFIFKYKLFLLKEGKENVKFVFTYFSFHLHYVDCRL